jgi:hypothetical protein
MDNRYIILVNKLNEMLRKNRLNHNLPNFCYIYETFHYIYFSRNYLIYSSEDNDEFTDAELYNKCIHQFKIIAQQLTEIKI